jgi:hypothetical protein
MAYSDNFEEILAQEAARRRELVTSQVEINGVRLPVRHSLLDMGAIVHLFDQDTTTLVRSAESNPLVVEIDFESPHPLAGIRARVGAEAVILSVIIVTATNGEIHTYTTRAGQVDDYKDVQVSFNTILSASRVRIELLDENTPEPTHVHMWEIYWLDGR